MKQTHLEAAGSFSSPDIVFVSRAWTGLSHVASPVAVSQTVDYQTGRPEVRVTFLSPLPPLYHGQSSFGRLRWLVVSERDEAEYRKNFVKWCEQNDLHREHSWLRIVEGPSLQ